jgi:hypothetical protein
MKKKQLIRLTEGDLHRVVKESVKNILTEIGDTARGQYMLGKLAQKKGEDRPENGKLGKMRKEKGLNPIFKYADKQQKNHKLGHDHYVSGMKNRELLDFLNEPNNPRDEKVSKIKTHRINNILQKGLKFANKPKPLDDVSTDEDLYNELKYEDSYYFPVKESKKSKLHRIIKESVKKVLKEEYSPFDETYDDDVNDYDLEGYENFLKKYGLEHASFPYDGIIVIFKDNKFNFMDKSLNFLSPVWFDEIDTIAWEKYGKIYCELNGQEYSFDSIQELIEYFQ